MKAEAHTHTYLITYISKNLTSMLPAEAVPASRTAGADKNSLRALTEIELIFDFR